MQKIRWDNSFSVNNTEIDNQHQKWIGIYNRMHEAMITGDYTTQQGLEILKEMLEYARFHFSCEEEYMRKIDYPDIVNHRRIHKDFDTLIYSYYRDIQDGKIVLGSQITKLIKNWLLDHILIEDKKYSVTTGDKS